MPERLGQWRAVETALEADIAAGRLAPGEQLPREADLCERFGVGRHSVRRALAMLVQTGRLRVKQGAGTYVSDRAILRYHIGERTRFSRNLAEQGFTAAGDRLAAATVDAPAEVSRALGIEEGAAVHRLVTLGLADGVPVSLGTSWHPADRLPDLLAMRQAGRSVTDSYAAHGIDDYTRRDTRIFARPALSEEARLLAQSELRPVIVAVKTDIDHRGLPIGHSEVVWSAERVQFTIGEESPA